ncbi:MAG: hypothetical protein II473_00500 [Clostridia bacterium]|nr:hypothetical protein [Clostridia bacterium]
MIIKTAFRTKMKRLIVFFSVFAGIYACTALPDNEETAPPSDWEWFSVSFEKAAEPGTKIFLNEDYKIRWNKDDRVSVFNKTSFNRQYSFTGEDGASSGTIKKVGTVFNTGVEISQVYAVYPYSAANSIGEDDEILSLTFPQEQTYLENSFGRGANLMVSVSEGVDNNLFFKNAGGYFLFKLYGKDVSVSSIVLTGNDSEPLSGPAKVTATPNSAPSVKMSPDASPSVSLICNPPVTLGESADNYTSFYLVIPPTKFKNGFSLVISGDGGTFVKNSSKTIEVPRNNIIPMVPLKVSFD